MTPERTCRYGHGPLDQELGFWSLERIKHGPPTGLMAIHESLLGPDPNIRLVVRAWTCRVCGYVELQDYSST